MSDSNDFQYFFHCPWCKKVTLFETIAMGSLRCTECEKRRATEDANNTDAVKGEVEPEGTV